MFYKKFELLFGVKSVRVLEEIRTTIRGEINPCFGRDSSCCFGVKSFRVLEEIRASVRGEINPCFERDSGSCLG